MTIPPPPEALSTRVTQDSTVVSDALPIRAACTSCHDDLEVDVHAVRMTDAQNLVESCIVCHGADTAFDSAAIHVLGP
jgi:cytochrome c553